MNHSANRRRTLVCLLLLTARLLAGCGKTSAFDGSVTRDADGFQMAYSMLNREETADLQLSEGERLQVAFSQEKGNVDIRVAQDGKDAIYAGNGQINGEFILIIPETGVYRISVVGHKAQGKVSFIRLPAAQE